MITDTQREKMLYKAASLYSLLTEVDGGLDGQYTIQHTAPDGLTRLIRVCVDGTDFEFTDTAGSIGLGGGSMEMRKK